MSIQGQLLEVTVVQCLKLKDTEWISRQDPYVCLEYASTKFRTRTCTDGGKNPVFQEKFMFNLIEGLREISVSVWNSNTLSFDDFIGNGKVQIQDALSRGYDDRAWALQTKTGRYAGEIKLIMHYANANKPAMSFSPSAPPYVASSQPHVSMYSAPSPAHTNSTAAYPPPPSAAYPPPGAAYPPPSISYTAGAYPPPPVSYASGAYPPPPVSYNSGAYPYPPNSAPHQPYPYPPSPYPPDQPAYPSSPYPPSSYPPPPTAYPPSPYPPPPHASQYSCCGHSPGIYPPPPY